jgi:hypothetical protein
MQIIAGDLRHLGAKTAIMSVRHLCEHLIAQRWPVYKTKPIFVAKAA